MIAKIVRILFIVISVFVMGFYLPTLYKKCFEKRPDKTMLYYSEISKDFILAQETGDSLSEKRTMQYYDRYNNQLSEQEAMHLLPFNNIKKLRLLELMPDSIDGVALTDDILKTVWRTMLISEQGFNYQINPLFESNPKSVYLSLPEDLFRINDQGIQFIKADNNKIDTEKSLLFSEALSREGFQAPSKSIYGIPSILKRKDDGYFIVDAANKLFHLKMIKGEPMCRKIDTDIDIKLIKCHSSGDGIFAHLFDKENNIYALTHDCRVVKLPINSADSKIFMIVSNYFYRTYKLTNSDSTTLYVLNPNFELVDKYSASVNNYSKTKEADIEKRIFPLKIMRTPGMAHFIPIPNPMSKFIVVNLILMVMYLGFKITSKQRILTLFNIVDLLLIGVFGVYAFIACLIFPNVESVKKVKIK